VVGVLTNVKDAYSLSRAQQGGIATQLLERLDGELREDYDLRLATAVAEFEPDFVVLAGWMRFLASYRASEPSSGRGTKRSPGTDGYRA
jgi:phosphoribosylglycinamide formyltransferase-1